jgi:purine-binding chemotaxis protein CheW
VSSTPSDRGAAALREAFDASFAAAPEDARREQVALLRLRAGGEELALRVLETGGLVALGRLTPLPARRPEVLGLTGLRGGLLPVLDLARLLRLPGQGAPRWMVLAGSGEERVGLAFDEFQGHARVLPGELHAAPASPRLHLREVVELHGRPVPVLAIPSLLHAVLGH